jgi:hypothetical protein
LVFDDVAAGPPAQPQHEFICAFQTTPTTIGTPVPLLLLTGRSRVLALLARRSRILANLARRSRVLTLLARRGRVLALLTRGSRVLTLLTGRSGILPLGLGCSKRDQQSERGGGENNLLGHD